MLSAISSAVQGGSELQSTITPSCDGVKCTWPEFETLGTCWSCKDIADQLQHGCLNFTQMQSDYTLAQYTYGYHCGFTIGPFLDEKDFYGYPNQSMMYTYYDPTGKSYSSIMTVYSDPSIAADGQNPLVRFNAVISPDGYQGLNQTPVAATCRLDYCVRSIKASYENGVLTENVTSSTDLKWDNTINYDGWALKLGDKRFHAAWDPALRDYVGASFLGRAYIKPDDADITWGLINMPSEPFVLSDDAIQASLQGVYRSFSQPPNNISVIVDRLASVMSNNIRTQKSNGTVQVEGTAWATETHVHVRWLWLLYPITLQTLSLVFLAWTMLRQNRSKLAIWKSSSLAALFHMDVSPRGEDHALLRRSELEQKASTIKVILSEKEGRWLIRRKDANL